MRFALAILSLVFSGVLLILGIGQRTFLAAPAEISISAELPSGTTFASIPGSVFEAKTGQPVIVVTGDDAFAATGTERDVTAWLEPVEHELYSDEASASKWESETVSAVVPVVSDTAESGESGVEQGTVETVTYDPRGSDLWLTEASAANSASGAGESSEVRLSVDPQDRTQILVSVSDATTTPASVSLVWIQDNRTPFAGPLILGGALFAILGLVLYLLAVDHDRRGLGPRRGQKGPFWGIRNSIAGSRRSRRSGAQADASGQTEPAASANSTGESPAASETEVVATPNGSETEKAVGDETGNESKKMQRRSLFRTRTRAVFPALAISSMLALSGCSAAYWPEIPAEADTEVVVDEEAQTTTAAPPPVTPEQIDRIIADVAAVAGQADDSLDASLLASRFTGDALAQRTANYAVRASVPDYQVIPPRITSQALEYELVQSTEGWPRTIFVTLESDPGAKVDLAEGESIEDVPSPSLALVLTQESPHENFLVSRIVSLRGGITMPEAAPAEEGTALLADDLQTLVLEPGQVGAAYAAILAGGSAVEQAALFDLAGDTLSERSGAAWASQSQATADAAEQGVSYSVTATQAATNIVSLSTGVGGALVATTVIEERIEEPSSGRWKPTPPASVTALSGLSGQQDKLVSVVTHQLLFFVPGKDSNEPIQLLGFSSDLTGARNS